MPAWAARLAGFAGLACLGALEWHRMVGSAGTGRALLWVLAALLTAAALVAADRLSGRPRSVAAIAVAAAAVLLAYAVSGAELRLLAPRHWDELASGVLDGARALGTVRLPYAGADAWPRVVLELLGAELLVLAALVAFWRRGSERGFPFIALAVLLILVASPVVSLGGARPVALGLVLTALCVCFLWLERLPLRPGVGVAALLGVALAGALPLAAAADRGEPWFDYKAFAEALGPDDPVHFAWDQSYAAVDWPRDGNEVLRVKSDQPYYWKAANLEAFDGIAWRARQPGDVVEPQGGDVPEDWRNRPGWTSTIDVSIRRMSSPTVIAAGSILGVRSSSRPLRPAGLPGAYVPAGDLRRGDSYTLSVHVPKPLGGALTETATGLTGRQADDLIVPMPLAPGRELSFHELGRGGVGTVDTAVLHVRPYGDTRGAYVEFPGAQRSGFRVRPLMRRTLYWRTWKLAQRLKRGTRTPLQYIVKVNAYLRDFAYSERPTPPPPGRAPLDAFLFDTREGFCQHFSGAMALLLRLGGVPARVAGGFSPGGYSARRRAWIVRDTDAHAWVEAWFDGTGWVTYDPTPPATPARSQIAALEDPAPAATPAPGETAAGGGGVRPNGSHGLRPDLLRADPAASAAGAQAGGGTPWWPFAAAALVVAAAALLLVSRLRRRLAELPPVERAVAELEAALRRAGRPAPPGTTLRQLEASLGGASEATAYLRALSAARYGAAAPHPTAAQRRALRRALAGGLGMTGRARAWWALPPRR
jgi:transglutaminase-like putative cysteine protease